MNNCLTIKNLKLESSIAEDITNIDLLTHNIHPYTAKLTPSIPRFLLNRYSKEDSLVLDPFCGSGTTLLEAKISGRNAVGIDINPLAVLISDVKTKPLDITELELATNLVKNEIRTMERTIEVSFPNIDYWFSVDARNELARIRFAIEAIKPKISEEVYKFLIVCFSSIIKKSSYADTRIPKTCKSTKMIERIRSGWKPTPIAYFNAILEKNVHRIASLNNCCKNSYVKVFERDARKTSEVLLKEELGKADLVVTSPPYINAQDYLRSYKLELFWLNMVSSEKLTSLKNNIIGTEHLTKTDYHSVPVSENRLLNSALKKIWQKPRKMNRKKDYIVYNYFENMREVLGDFQKVIREDGFFCLIIGNNTICEVAIPTFNILVELAKNEGFELIEIYRDQIKNRSLFPNRNHKCGTIREEWIAVFHV